MPKRKSLSELAQNQRSIKVYLSELNVEEAERGGTAKVLQLDLSVHLGGSPQSLDSGQSKPLSAKLYRVLGFDPNALDCDSKIIIYASLHTEPAEGCSQEEVLYAYIPRESAIRYTQLEFGSSITDLFSPQIVASPQKDDLDKHGEYEETSFDVFSKGRGRFKYRTYSMIYLSRSVAVSLQRSAEEARDEITGVLLLAGVAGVKAAFWLAVAVALIKVTYEVARNSDGSLTLELKPLPGTIRAISDRTGKSPVLVGGAPCAIELDGL